MPFSVPSDSQFFLAVCKKGTIHSYIVAGVQYAESSQNHILCGAGKVIRDSGENSGPWDYVKFAFNFLFNKAEGKLKNESWIFRSTGPAEKVSYKAFPITKENYGELLNLISSSQHADSEIKAAKIISEDTQQIHFEREKLITDKAKTPSSIDHSISAISKEDSCRTSALTILDTVIPNASQNSEISTSFLTALPFEGVIHAGKFHGNFYVLPMPPSASSPNYFVLKRIYTQLEKIPKKHSNEKLTRDKFKQLKSLYDQLNDQKPSSLKELFSKIETWEKTNKDIDKQRGFNPLSFFGAKTATRNMLNELNEWKAIQSAATNKKETKKNKTDEPIPVTYVR